MGIHSFLPAGRSVPGVVSTVYISAKRKLPRPTCQPSTTAKLLHNNRIELTVEQTQQNHPVSYTKPYAIRFTEGACVDHLTELR